MKRKPGENLHSNMTYKIEKNIPIGQLERGKYPFKMMAVGNSFKFPRESAQRVSVSASIYARKNGAKFTQRTGEKFGRIWRIK